MNTDNNANEYVPESDGLYPMFLLQLSTFWNYFCNVLQQLVLDVGVYEIFEKMARQSVRHPFVTVALSVVIISLGLPLLVLTVFIFSTVAMTFSGFVLLEGTLISIASVLLFGCLGAMLIVFLFFGGVTVAGYLGFLHIYDLYEQVYGKKVITKFLQSEGTNTL